MSTSLPWKRLAQHDLDRLALGIALSVPLAGPEPLNRLVVLSLALSVEALLAVPKETAAEPMGEMLDHHALRFARLARTVAMSTTAMA